MGGLKKALIGTIEGGLKAEIVDDGIRMFRSNSIKEAISLARMQDEQLSWQEYRDLP